jgi:hypothetical protein
MLFFSSDYVSFVCEEMVTLRVMLFFLLRLCQFWVLRERVTLRVMLFFSSDYVSFVCEEMVTLRVMLFFLLRLCQFCM